MNYELTPMNYNELIKNINPSDHYNQWTDEYKTLKATQDQMETYQNWVIEDFITDDDAHGYAEVIAERLCDLWTEDLIKWLGNPEDNYNHLGVFNDYMNRTETLGDFNLPDEIRKCQVDYYRQIVEQDIRPLLLGIVKDAIRTGGTK